MSAQTNSSSYHLRAIVVVIEMNFSIGRCSLRVFQSFLLLAVILLVKVGEEEQEHDAVKTDPHHESLRVLAIGPEQLELMSEDGNKLNLLKESVVD